MRFHVCGWTGRLREEWSTTCKDSLNPNPGRSTTHGESSFFLGGFVLPQKAKKRRSLRLPVDNPRSPSVGGLGIASANPQDTKLPDGSVNVAKARRGVAWALSWLSLGNILHFCLLRFGGKSPLNCYFVFSPSNVNQAIDLSRCHGWSLFGFTLKKRGHEKCLFRRWPHFKGLGITFTRLGSRSL